MPGYLLRASADNRGELHSGQLHDAWRPMGSIVLLALHSARWLCRPGAAFLMPRAPRQARTAACCIA
ncbi:hypothetical protein, partial [Xanthomonas oryzae]